MGAAAVTNDLFAFDATSADEVGAAIKEYKRRCALILTGAFGSKIDVIRNFEAWFDEYVKSIKDRELLLHDEPLYTASRFLGLDPKTLPRDILHRAERLATQENWY